MKAATSSSPVVGDGLLGGVQLFFYQLTALMYKNVILGIRLWKTTLCHLLLPCIMIIIFGIVTSATATTGEVRVSSTTAEFKSTESEVSGGLPPCRVFDTIGGRYGNGNPIPNFPCVTLAFAPNNVAEINGVMQKVADLNGLTFSQTLSETLPLPGVMGFASTAALIQYASANPGRIGHGVTFPPTFVVQMNGTIQGGPTGIPTIPIEVLYNKTAVGQFYANTGDDLLFLATAVVTTPLKVQRAVIEAVLALHTGSDTAQLEFDVRKFPTTSDRDATSALDSLVGIFVYLGVMIPFVLTIRHVVAEKENNILDAMRMTGLRESAYWLSWFIYFAITSLISTILMYIAGVAMQTPIFIFVDGDILFAVLYVYFLATLCMALMLSAMIPSTRTAVMVGFCFLAIGVVVQAMFSVAPFISTLVYNPHILPTAGLKALNLYPPIVLARITTDMSNTIQPYIPEGSKNLTRNRYTRQHFMDGFYRYGLPESPENHFQANYTGCLVDSTDNGGFGSISKCNIHSASCPFIFGVPFTGVCPEVTCSSSWSNAFNGSAAICADQGGLLVQGKCICRWINDSDETNLNTLVGLMFLYLIAAWYAGQVCTYGHGRPEAFYFPFLPWYWFPGLKPQKRYGGTFGIAKDADVLAEEEQIKSGAYDSSRPVVARGLKRVFGNFTAVNGLSFSMEKGKCFALLGHNGAGKTTAIKMLNGLINITDGDVVVDGKSVRDALASVRKDIGACPQHDILWPELSAYQHLKFFGIFQGLGNVNVAVREMLAAVRLNREGSNPSSSFSGGMKRRLSVAIASLGNKKVVILDEPTTGMDPQNRSHVWKMIAELKKDRVVLLTTHSMEEAEYLGDEIGIMSHGHLIALGTTLKLKSKFGGGYRLKLVVGNNSSAQDIREAVTKYVPGAVLLDQSAGDLSYDLPGSSDRQLPELFRWIESQSGALNDWAVSQVSLEDIFIRLTKDSMPEQELKAGGKGEKADKKGAIVVAEDAAAANAAAGEAEGDIPEAEAVDMDISGQTQEHSCLSSYLSQFRGVFLKTWALFRRNKYTMCCQLILPLGLICIIFGIKYSVEEQLKRFGFGSSTVQECTNCMRTATYNYIDQEPNYLQCLQSFTPNFCVGYGTGIFEYKNDTTDIFPESAWTTWLAKFPNADATFQYKFNVEADLVETNPVYSFCLIPNNQLGQNCQGFQSAKQGNQVQEPAAFFAGGSPMGLNTDTPVRVMVVSPSGQDIGSKCFNNSNLLHLPPFVSNTHTYIADTQFGPRALRDVSICTQGYNQQGERFRQFPRLSAEEYAALNTGTEVEFTCNATVNDFVSYEAAKNNSDDASDGLMGFFPSDIVEGPPQTEELFVLFANLSDLALTDEQIFGLANLTGSCSDFQFSNFLQFQFNGCSVSCFQSFVQNTRDAEFNRMTDVNGRQLPVELFRLDVCRSSRPALYQSPAICPLEDFEDVAAKHLQGEDLQARADSYMFDMQDALKNRLLPFAERKYSKSIQGTFEARMAQNNHFPDVTLVMKEFNASRARLRFSLQSYFMPFNGFADYRHTGIARGACVGDEVELLALLEPLGLGVSNYELTECASGRAADNFYQSINDLIAPGFKVQPGNRNWGKDVDDSSTAKGKIGGEETFVVAGIATAALRYVTANGLADPASPVGTDPDTRFVLGARAFPYPDTTVGASSFDISSIIALMVDLLVPFATTMLWPVFVYGFVQEKELKLRAMQTMMGMRQDVYFLVHYVFDFSIAFTMLVLIYVLGFFMSIPFFSQNEGALIILLFWIWANTLVAMTFFFQTFLSRTRTSNIIIYMLLLASVIGSFLANLLAFTASFIPAPPGFLVWPPFVFYRAISIMNKRTFFLADLNLSEELSRLIGILFIETMILFIAAFYLDLVIPREYGRPRHPFFCFVEPYRAWRKRRDGNKTADEHREHKGDEVQVVVADGEKDFEMNSPLMLDLDRDLEAEDVDVAAERKLVESGQYSKLPAVEVAHVRKVYPSGKVAVEDVTMHMETGEVFCLLGPNGAGKSTVIGVLTGLFSLSKGSASVNGFDVMTEMHRVYEGLGVTPQFDTLWPSLTVKEHLLYYARIKGVPRRDEMKFVIRAAQAVRLGNAMNKRSRQLSGGMRRRLSLAISLVGNPLTIFLDEPTTGLDPETRRQIWQLIESEKKERCIVLTTHSMEEAEALSNRVAIMAHGLLKTVGTTMQLKAKYGDGYRIQVSFRQGREQSAEDFVRNAIPGAVLAESRMGIKTYKVARDQGKVSEIFEAFLMRDVETSGVEDWGIEQSTLEQVFLKIATESERVYGTA